MIAVKEVFATMQGEGSRTGTPCVFIRLAGCNLWAGLEAMRPQGAGVCAAWCDTDFAKGDRWEPAKVVDEVMGWMPDWPKPAVVISGGEPCLQLRQRHGEQLVSLLQQAGVHVAVETNGTVAADVLAQVDHVTVSPKQLRAPGVDPLAHVVVRTGTDLKVVHPQWDMGSLMAMDEWDFDHKFFQPLDTFDIDPHDAAVIAMREAAVFGWRLSIQTHKLLDMP